MANDVYRRAHATLSTMVSGRAATRILRQALRGAGCDADTVNAIEMRDLLLDTVLADLERILPRDGVKRSLRALAKELLRSAAQRDPFSTEADVPSDLTSAGRDDAATRSEAFGGGSGAPLPPARLEVENRPVAAPRTPTTVPPVPSRPRGAGAATPRANLSPKRRCAARCCASRASTT